VTEDPTPPTPATPATPPVPPAPDLRASDAEREQAVEILGRAATDGRLSVDELDGRLTSAYTARTRRELAVLTADVSIDPALEGPVPAGTGPGGLIVREGPGGTGWVVSILGGHDRSGHWRIARTATVLNVMGGSDIDLCQAELSGRETQLNVYSLMGGSEIRVPAGVRVEVTKFALMGGHDVDLGDERPPADAPLIRMRILTVMGGVSVRRGPKQTRAERRQARDVRKAAEVTEGGRHGRHDELDA
jgi:hypothetical protein